MATQPPNTAKTKPSRLPAPALFIGPPSRNASTLSIPRTTDVPSAQPTSSKPRLPGTTSTSSPLQVSPRPVLPIHHPQTGSVLDITRVPPQAGDSSTSSRGKPAAQHRPSHSRASLDAQWAELQRTMDEVESAGDGRRAGGTVFGAAHGRALEELRVAQVRLAEAWGENSRDQRGGNNKGEGKGDDDDDDDELGKNRREDGERDLRSAKERRERNEEYFAKVKVGVQEVVGKLDEVSKAMKRVEGEGREMWEESSEGGSQSGERT